MVSMTSFEILPMDPNEGMQGPSSNFTFIQDIVIPHPEPIPNDSASSDFDSVLNHRLEELLDENNKLKDKIQHNNKVMEDLLNTISSWQKIMAETNNKHRTILTNAVEDNHKLLSEKEDLCKKVSQLENAISEAEKGQITQCNRLKELEKEYMNLTSENEDLKEVIQDQKNEQKKLEEEISNLSTQLARLTLEFKLLEEEKNDFKQSYLSLQEKQHTCVCGGPNVLEEDVNGYEVVTHPVKLEKEDGVTDEDSSFLEVQLSKSKVEHLSGQLDEEKHMVENLMQLLEEKDAEIEKLKVTNDEKIEWEKKFSEKAQEFSELEEKLKLTYAELEKHKNKYDSSVLTIAGLRGEVKQFTEQLAVEKMNHQTTKEVLTKAENMLKELSTEKENLSLLLEENSSMCIKEEEELSRARANLEQQSLLKLDGLTAKICYLEDELEAERQNVTSLTRQLTSQNGDNEAIRVLKEQVNMYKSDFECEKLARVSAEKELREQMEKVEQLKNQLEGKAGRHHNSRSWKGSSRYDKRHFNGTNSEPTIVNTSAPEISNMQCPCCPCTFFSYPDLERHVLECMDKHKD